MPTVHLRSYLKPWRAVCGLDTFLAPNDKTTNDAASVTCKACLKLIDHAKLKEH